MLLVPSQVFAQATIAGVVRDTSGAVLPGVTVEAASDVLIEKARTAVTDSTGRYQIVDLRAGRYVVSFTLPGFSTVKREGIELTGVATAAVNAELRVGAIEETVTVTGETPIVDVQSVRRQATITGEVLATIPTARGYSGVMLLVPAIQTQGSSPANVQATPGMVVFGTPGGRNGNEGRLQVDGLGVGAARNGGGVSGYNADIANAQEISFTVSAGLGEAEVSGPTLSVVPKTGGNAIHGSVFLAGVSRGHGGQQLHPRAAGRGARHAGPAAQALGLHRRHRRPDQEGSPLVLPEPAQPGIALVGVGDVREPERGRPDEVDLPGRHHAPVAQRRELDGGEPAAHRAGDAEEQVQRLLGRAEAVHRRHLRVERGRLPAASPRRAASSTAARPPRPPKPPPTRTGSSACSS